MWVTFEDGTTGFVAGGNEEQVRMLAFVKTGKQIKSVQQIPYPANPIIVGNGTPAFCWTPKECAGRSCCPHNRSCTD